jgi:hypothetical protein
LTAAQPVPTQQPDVLPDDIVVNAPQTVTPDVPFSAVLPTLPAITAPLSDPALMQPDVRPDDIVVTGAESYDPTELLAALGGAGALTAAATAGGVGAGSNVVNGIDQATGDIVVDAPQTVTPDVGLPVGSVLSTLPITGLPTADPALTSGSGPKLGIKDYIDIATLLGGLIPGASGGGGSSFNLPAGAGGLSSLFSKQLPPSTLLGGGALPASALAAQGLNSPQDYYRYGYGPEQSFFSYVPQGAPNTSRAYTGYEGSTAEDAFAPQPVRIATSPVALPQPITTPIPNNPAGPSMYAPEADNMRFARGGFAVEGAGDGRDDKIPALLSDGEYVIDAETVALLGNGSNKAGAKLLDSFRVKVRKQKGKKLARGKFSDNAKRPEQYMAGGPA